MSDFVGELERFVGELARENYFFDKHEDLRCIECNAHSGDPHKPDCESSKNQALLEKAARIVRAAEKIAIESRRRDDNGDCTCYNGCPGSVHKPDCEWTELDQALTEAHQ